MKNEHIKNKISSINFVLEIMTYSYLSVLFFSAVSGLLMVIVYHYNYAPSNLFIYFIRHPFLGILTLGTLAYIYSKMFPKFKFFYNRLLYSLFESNKTLKKSKPKGIQRVMMVTKLAFIYFNLVLILSVIGSIDELFFNTKLTSLHNLFNDKYNSFIDPGMWIWSLIYFIQILIIFFYLKYKYESPKQKSLIDKTMEIYNSPEAKKYRESKYERYITVILLSGFWIFLHQIALILIRIFNQ